MAQQKPGERKHLFGTTEKSDFILNMNQQQTFKLCGLYSIIAIAVLAAINIPFTILKHTFDYKDEEGVLHYADDLVAHYASILVVGAGLIGFWFFLVARMKKEIKNEKRDCFKGQQAFAYPGIHNRCFCLVYVCIGKHKHLLFRIS